VPGKFFFNPHKGRVNSAVFSPDGTRILTASADGTAKVWYTPEAIYEWLKTAPIPPLSAEEKKELRIN
jgi:WD40 repeat protein